jgi:Icc protein
MNDVVRPDLVVNLGDDIEDESREADLARYGECQAILREARAPLVNVAGNHDTVHLNRDDLNRFWGRTRPALLRFDMSGWHFVVLHTIEKQDVEIRVPSRQSSGCAPTSRRRQPRRGRIHASFGERTGRR